MQDSEDAHMENLKLASHIWGGNELKEEGRGKNSCRLYVSISAYSLLPSIFVFPFPYSLVSLSFFYFPTPSLLFFLRRYSNNDNELFLYDFITFFIDYLFDLNILVCLNYISMVALQTLLGI